MQAMKKNGSAVFLMELILVILFFSLSTVVTLRLFVTAHQQEEQSTLRSDALELAENTAELFRAYGTGLFTSPAWITLQETGEDTHYSHTADGLTARVSLHMADSPEGSLSTGEIVVYQAGSDGGTSGDPLCRLALGRYVPAWEVAS